MLLKISAPAKFFSENVVSHKSCETLYLLVKPAKENMLFVNFIRANVKNNNPYLKTNLLKKCYFW